MSTQCGIAVKTEKGYDTIYVHSDGYPEYMWPMLTENYNSEELAAKLVSLGDASYIDKKLEPTSDFHKFGTPEPNVSMFYHRDRGDDWEDVSPALYQHHERKRLLREWYYLYIFDPGLGCWTFYKDGRKIY
jgi:hypothetical protein